MEINEVKVGDMVTYKNKQGKQVKGKVIHRHDGKDHSHLTGHVNIQKIGGVPSFPVTVHVSDIKPHITEETDMQDENVYTMIDSIQTGDNERAETLFREIMNTKIADVLASNKEEVAKSMFNTNECADCEAEEVDEALVGGQKKIDKNHNGKLDGQDFKMLRAKKGVKEEYVDEADAHSYVGGMDKIGKHSQPGDNTMRKVRKNVPLMKKIDAARKASMHAGLAKGAEMSLAKDPTDAGDRSKNIARTSGNAATRFARIAKGKAPFQKEEVHLDELNQQTYFNAATKRAAQAANVAKMGHSGIAPEKKLKDKAYNLNAWGNGSEKEKENRAIKKSLSPATKRAIGVRESIEEKVQQLSEISKKGMKSS